MRMPLRSLLPLTILLIALSGCSSPETTNPVVKDITLSVYAPGRIIDPDGYDVYAPVSGILAKWEVSEGDTVAPQQVIGHIEGDVSTLNAANAGIRLNEAKRNLSPNSPVLTEARIALENARLKFQNDSLMFSRQKNLWEKGVGTRMEYDNRKLAFENAQNQVRMAREQLVRLKNNLEAELDQAANLYAIATNQSDDFAIKSKIRGIVRELNLDKGELVSPQQPVARLGGTSPFKVELQVDEVDMVRLEVGQRVMLGLDAYPDSVFEGKLTYITPRKGPRDQSFKVEVEFKERPSKMLEGMTAEGNILIETRKEVLLVPLDYVLPGNKVITGKEDTLNFTPGISDLEYVEVKAGELTTATVLIKP